jgi:arginyl-tRNA synthetase
MQKVIELCEKAGATTRNEDGSLAIVPPEETGLPSFLIQKSDGATLYHTSDLATIRYRLDEFQPKRIVYFVAEQQSLHFKQLFWLAEKVGLDKAKLEHASFGMVRLPEGTMSTRKGNVVRLSALLDEGHERALQVIQEKKPDLPEVEWDSLAEAVGVGAIIYADLGKDRTKAVVFDWDTALSFEGQSGPYLQYAYARACAILRKAELQEFTVSLIKEKEEKNLLKTLLRFEDVLGQSVLEAKPSYVAQWLFDLATVFNKFYTTQPVLKAEGEVRESRLALVKIFAETLGKGLGLLGMKAPEKM